MPTKKTNKIPFEVGKRKPISFSMRVIATDLPPEDNNFKIKLAIDFIPEFVSDEVRTEPNFNGNRVYEILQFISEGVITKAIEFAYYDPSKVSLEKKQDGNFNTMKNIYAVRKKSKDLDHREDEITTIIKALLNNKKRIPSEKESSISSIRYEQFSPIRMTVSYQTVVNGEKKLPGGTA